MILRIWDVTLTVADLQRSADFYENVLGLTKKYEFKDYVGFDCGGVELGLKTWGKRETPREGEPCLDLLVPNVDEEYQRMKAKGAHFTKEPHDTLWGSRTALFTDPDGHVFTIVAVDWNKYLKVSAPKL
jgi:lactoylglutathione lyase